MNTANSSATVNSRKTHTIAPVLRQLCSVALVALAAACTTLPPSPKPTAPATADATQALLRAVTFAELPGWTDDPQSDAWPAFVVGCGALTAQPFTALSWREPCASAREINGQDASAVRAFFERYFTPYQVATADGRDSGLVTGYYEPLLNGSKSLGKLYRYPLFAPPDDLLTIDLAELYPELRDKRLRGRVEGKRVVPYWTRADIEAGRAAMAGKELVYVDDPVEAFFLQIQGSGRVRLAEGGTMRIGYADQNGQPFRSIARLLIDRGDLTLANASMQGIKQWAKEHPAELPALLDANPSYVFFREIVPDPTAGVDGPIGTLGVPLAAGRALAIDPRFLPLGAPIFLATTYPLSTRPLNRLMLAQDTGGAIRGALRGDFFWGFGDEAAREAGRMKQSSRMWLLWPKDAAPPAVAASLLK